MTPTSLAALHACAFQTERPWTAEEFASLCAAPHTHLIYRDHSFVLWRGVADEAELLTIAVHPAWQNQGVGGQLMTEWMAAAALKANKAFLEVASDNGPACALYARFGFETVARRAGYYTRSDSKADALVMRASLPFIT